MTLALIKIKIVRLFQQLYPTGRAFRMAEGSWREARAKALAVSEAQGVKDAVSILDSMIPDNDNFDVNDASDWERRLGLTTNSATALADRKAAILTKMAHPGTNPAKQHYLYLQKKLQDAGFDVYVFENIPAVSPVSLNAGIVSEVQYAGFQYGAKKYAKYINHIVANSLDNDKDVKFNPGDNFRCTFFIGGTPVGTMANVPASREEEFRQTILRYKPVQTIAVLFINYT